MKLRLTRAALLAALLCASAAAQQVTRVWTRVAPEDEEFAVLMPETNFRIRRELPFGSAVTLKPASFEIANRGILFSVLSFSKAQKETPKSLDEFVRGFRYALQKNSGGLASELSFERDVTLEGRRGRQFRLAVGGARGAARVYETQNHFYVVLTLGGAADESAPERFQSSFTFDKSGEGRVSAKETTVALTEPRQPPAPLWPVAGGSSALSLVVGNADPQAQGRPGPDVDAPASAGRKIISGGVLNGKAVAKPQPVYPPIAKAARAQGTVVVQILVDEEGYVIAATAVSGHPLLQQAAVAAARQARFTPTLLEGRPVKVSGVITYNFVLV
jgi:TonB family protein